MPSYICRCDENLDIGNIPNPNEWLVISDVQYDNYVDNINSEELYKQFIHMLKCPKCSRIWVFWDGFENEPMSYMQENNT